MGDYYYWAPSQKLGLPTCDINCLHALTYIKLSGACVNLHPILQNFKGEGKVLGRLHTQDNVDITKSSDVITHLKQKGFDLDVGIVGDATSDIVPFTALIEEKLLPAVLYMFWMDAENYSAVTHPTYAKSCQLPCNFVVPNRMKERVAEFVKESKFWGDEESMQRSEMDKLKGMFLNNEDGLRLTEKFIDRSLTAPACSVLNLFSEYLGVKEYIFGDKPSSVDALLFSILAPLLKFHRLRGSRLRSELTNSSNLCQYINRMLRNNFESELEATSPTGDGGMDTSDQAPLDDVDWKNDVVLPVGVAAFVMVSYAINVFYIAGK